MEIDKNKHSVSNLLQKMANYPIIKENLSIIKEIQDILEDDLVDNIKNNNIKEDLKNALSDYLYRFSCHLDDTEANNPLEIPLTLFPDQQTSLIKIIQEINTTQNNFSSSLKNYPKLRKNLLIWTLKQSESIREIPLLSLQQIESLAKDSMGNVKLYLLSEYEEESKLEELKEAESLKESKKLKLMNISDSMIIEQLSYYKNDRIYPFPSYDMKNSGHMDSLLFATEDNYEHYSPIHIYGIYVKNIETHKYEELQKENPIKIEERIYINKFGIPRSIYYIVMDKNNYTTESLQNFFQKSKCHIYFGNLETRLFGTKLHWGVLNNRFIMNILKTSNNNSHFNLKGSISISHYKLNYCLLCVLFDYYDSNKLEKEKSYDKNSYNDLFIRIFKRPITSQGKNNLFRLLEFNLYENNKKTLDELLQFCLLIKEIIDSKKKSNITEKLKERIKDINNKITEYQSIRKKKEEKTSVLKKLEGEIIKLHEEKEAIKELNSSLRQEVEKILEDCSKKQNNEEIQSQLFHQESDKIQSMIQELYEEIINIKKQPIQFQAFKEKVKEQLLNIEKLQKKRTDLMKKKIQSGSFQKETEEQLINIEKLQEKRANLMKQHIQFLFLKEEEKEKFYAIEKLQKEIKDLESKLNKYESIIGPKEKKILNTKKLKLLEKKKIENAIAKCKSTKEKNEEEFKKLQEERRILQIEIEGLEKKFPIFTFQLIKSVETIEDLEKTPILKISDELKEKIKNLLEPLTKYKSLEKEEKEKLHKMLELEEEIKTLDQNLIIYKARKIKKIERFYEVENLQEKIQDLQEEFTKYYDQNIKIDDKKQVENSINHLTKEMFRNLDKLLTVEQNQEKISESFYFMIGKVSEIFYEPSYFPNITPLSVFLIMNFKYEAISYEERYKTSLDVMLPF